jgi:hypothetical protein
VWQYAVTAEVFALNNLLCALVVYSCLSFAVSKRFKDACIGAFFVGLSLTNQHTAVLFCAPIAAWVVLVALGPLLWWRREGGGGGGKGVVSRLVALGLSGLLGLSPYMYLPLSAWLNPKPGAWGHVRSFGGLLHHLRRGDYGSFQLYSGGSGSESPWERAGRWLDDLVMRQSPDITISMNRHSQGTPPPLLWLRWIPLVALGGLGACCLVLVPVVKMMRENTTSAEDVGGGSKKKAAVSGGNNNDDDEGGSESSSKKKKKKGSTDQDNKTKDRKEKEAPATTSPAPTAAAAEEVEADTRLVGPLLVFTLYFYLAVFHTLANMPLDNPLLFGIHARFWQQPNWLVCLFVGVGLHLLASTAEVAIQITMGTAATSINKAVLVGESGGEASTPGTQRSAFGGAASSSSSNKLLTALISAACALLLVHAQVASSYAASDQSENKVFGGYARAVLEPLPPKSLLLINYDQQWTSCRYFQVCEGAAPGVTILNLAMMTFNWWQHKRELYPAIKWPGTHYTMEQTVAWQQGGFTFGELVEQNLKRFPGGIYLGGSLSYPGEKEWPTKFEFVPFGLLSRVLPHHSPQAQLDKWEPEADRMMGEVVRIMWAQRALTSLWGSPSPLSNDGKKGGLGGGSLGGEAKYDEETWEWTVGREFLDHSAEHAAYLLEKALEEEDKPAAAAAPAAKSKLSGVTQDQTARWRLSRILTAASWLELSVNLDQPQLLKTSVLKNLGLAYMHVVRDKVGAGEIPPPPAAAGAGAAVSKAHRLKLEAAKKPGGWADADPSVTGWPDSGAALVLEWAKSFDRENSANNNASRSSDSSKKKNKNKNAKKVIAGLNLRPLEGQPGVAWRTWASQRFTDCWGEFLRRPDAKNDPSYQGIKNIYEAVTKASSSSTGSSKSKGGNQKRSSSSSSSSNQPPAGGKRGGGGGGTGEGGGGGKRRRKKKQPV